MSSFIKKIICRLCNGSKKSITTGMMWGTCVECSGDGYIYDVLTDEEIKQFEEKERLKTEQEKRLKKEKMVNDIALKLTYKNVSISIEEAKKIAEEELRKQEELEIKNDLDKENTEKSRKPRKKKEEVLDQPKEKTAEDLIDSL